MVGRELLAVHLEREQHVVERLVDRQRAADVAVAAHGRVEALGHHVDGVAAHAGALEQRRERDAAPAREADRAQPPLGP